MTGIPIRLDPSLAEPEPAGLPADGDAARAGEADLIVASRSDPEAFGELYLRYLPRIHRYLRARSSSDADAADLAQDVFLRALAALPAYDDRGLPFGAWLFRIARNRSADAARQTHRHPPPLPLPDDPTDAGDPQDLIVRREDIVELVAIIRGLDEDQQELLALRFGARLTAREIGLVLGIGEAAVQQRFTRLLAMLKERSRAR